MSVLTTRGWYGSLPNSFLVFVSNSRFRALDSLQLFHIHFSYFTFTSAKFYVGIVEEKFTSAISHSLQLFHIHFSYFTSTSAKQNCRKIAESCSKIAHSQKTTHTPPSPPSQFFTSVIFLCLLRRDFSCKSYI